MHDLHDHLDYQSARGTLGLLFYRICKSTEAVTMRRVSDAALKLSGCALTKSI